MFGSPAYMAPEILSYEFYSDKIDVWSFGISLYELLTGYIPFIGRNKQEILSKIQIGEYSWPE